MGASLTARSQSSRAVSISPTRSKPCARARMALQDSGCSSCKVC
jgi:hypothetical protein